MTDSEPWNRRESEQAFDVRFGSEAAIVSFLRASARRLLADVWIAALNCPARATSGRRYVADERSPPPRRQLARNRKLLAPTSKTLLAFVAMAHDQSAGQHHRVADRLGILPAVSLFAGARCWRFPDRKSTRLNSSH